MGEAQTAFLSIDTAQDLVVRAFDECPMEVVVGFTSFHRVGPQGELPPRRRAMAQETTSLPAWRCIATATLIAEIVTTLAASLGPPERR
jgi:hypothetical protein